MDMEFEHLDSDEEEQSDMVYMPKVKEDCKPKIGQEFHSLDEAYEFYNTYAKVAGFSIRSNYTKKDKEGNEITRKEYCCFKEGKPKQKNKREKKRRRGIVREGCKAKLSVLKNKLKSGYSVSQFIEVHNHSLSTPHKVHLLRSHRGISDTKKSLSNLLSSANIPINQQISILSMEAGGIENIGCTEKDLRNFVRDSKSLVDGHDAEILMEYFLSEQEKNSSFSFKTETGDENRLTHCFWADANAIRAYKLYGDVVVFDTTYKTNKYGMIFAPFVGVNKHRQTVIFGCAFLCDETTESFIWLLQKWMEVMSVGPPKMIITDQDPAMSKAIAQALPNTYHRYCIWHILNKFSEKLDAIIYRDHYTAFQKCIWNTESGEEFEAMWQDTIGKSELKDNTWLAALYGIRSRWVPSFVKHIFAAGMSSSQRAESSHAFFKRYVSKENSLNEFVTRFNRALEYQRHKELQADHVDSNERPVLKTPISMEKQMADIYTLSIFLRFQNELWESLEYFIESSVDNEKQVVYMVKRPNAKDSRLQKVVYDMALNFATCSCKKFEFEGIPCRHILAYLKVSQIVYLPDAYILSRWRKDTKLEEILTDGGKEVKENSNNFMLLRHTKLSHLTSRVLDDAVVCEEASEVYEEHLKVVHEKIKEVLAIKGVGISPTEKPHRHVTLNEPNPVRAKGSRKHRLQGGKEKAQVQACQLRRCNGCGLTGQSHDKRNCPKLIGSTDTQSPADGGGNSSASTEVERLP